MSETFLNGRVELHCGDMLVVLPTLAENSIDSCVCDPPYHLTSIVKRFGSRNAAPAKSNGATGIYRRASRGFIGKRWDGGDIAFAVTTWSAVFRVLKPGAHLIAFAATRNYHRMACAIEDAGFEIRDQAAWCYGSGFPKSHDVSKAIDRELGRERRKIRVANVRNPKVVGGGRDGTKEGTRPWIERAIERGYHEAVSHEAVSWIGWGTALKPAWEPIVVARKPLSEQTIAANVLRWGTGALNIDASRIPWTSMEDAAAAAAAATTGFANSRARGRAIQSHSIGTEYKIAGRWPSNLIHDGSDEVLETLGNTAAVARFFIQPKPIQATDSAVNIQPSSRST